MIRSQPPFPLDSKQAAVALTVARETALRFKDSSQIGTAITLAQEQTAFPKSVYWRPYGIAQGYAGLAVVCGYLDACFPDERWDIIGHQYLEIATRGVEKQTQVSTGLFAGLSGLAFAVWYLSYQGTRYRKLLAALEEMLLPQVGTLAQQLTRQKQGLPVQQFDLISGLTGVGTYLLCRREEPRPAFALQSVLRCFTDLILSESKGIPCWYTPAHHLEETTRQHYPNGNLNCGLAHGIPGPLALLSLAYREGVEVEGLAESIERVADWLCQNFLEDEWGINWPNAIPLAPDQTAVASARALRGSRAAWCYGSPGVARSLWLAGQALNRTDYQEQAIAAMEAVYRRPLNVRNIDSPTFCHGVAGLLQITLRFARDTGLPLFTEAVENLSEQLFSLYEPESLLGYRCLEPGNRSVDKPGMLDGAPGVVLVLLAVATDIEPAWDRLFLLS
jgi:lantibiotic biosynthesis protein